MMVNLVPNKSLKSGIHSCKRYYRLKSLTGFVGQLVHAQEGLQLDGVGRRTWSCLASRELMQDDDAFALRHFFRFR